MILRTVVCMVVLVVAETIPHFGAVLSFVGGSSITIMGFICPPIFYFKLALTEGPWEKM